MRKDVVVILFFILSLKGFGQIKAVQFEQIDSLQQLEKRSIIVFIYTDWCKYCKAMHDKTFKNKEVEKLLNEKFYFIDFNAEEKRKIIFNAARFEYKPNGNNSGIHELAIELGTINNQISYPILCVLNDKYEIVFQNNSFLNAKYLLNILEQL